MISRLFTAGPRLPLSVSEEVKCNSLRKLQALIDEDGEKGKRADSDVGVEEQTPLVRAEQPDPEIGSGKNNPSFKVLSTFMMERFLEQSGFDIDASLARWNAYQDWRATTLSHSRSHDELELIAQLSGFVEWTGRDSAGRRCCYLTARHFNVAGHRRAALSFSRFVLEQFETGVSDALSSRSTSSMASSTIAVIYDRRGSSYDNVDPHLATKLRDFVSLFREYYSHFIGVVYIVHVNWFLWIFFVYICDPILRCCLRGRRLIVLREARDILEFVDLEQIPVSLFTTTFIFLLIYY